MKLKAVPKAAENNVIDIRELLDTRPCPIDSLVTRSNFIQEACHDYNVAKVTLRNVIFHDGELRFIDNSEDTYSYPLTRFAMSQLGTKIGVPSSYLQKCLDSGRTDLCADNINSWLEDYGKDLFIREYAGRIRGVLSSKYSVCDTPEILNVLRDTVDLNTYKIKGQFLNEERLHVRLVGKEMLPIDGEDLFPGIFVDSSDVGRNVLTVQFGIYKQVCTNGLVVSKGAGVLFQQKHIGISRDEFYEGLVASLSKVDVLCENSVEMVRYAQSKKMRIGKMNTQDFNDFIDQIKGTTRLSTDSANKVVDFMLHKYGESRWGYINALTEVAQDFTLERRIELEKIAGNLLAA